MSLDPHRAQGVVRVNGVAWNDAPLPTRRRRQPWNSDYSGLVSVRIVPHLDRDLIRPDDDTLDRLWKASAWTLIERPCA
jgi:hypothetical protein